MTIPGLLLPSLLAARCLSSRTARRWAPGVLVVALSGCYWDHSSGSRAEECSEDYFDCVEDRPHHLEVCEEIKDACLASCDSSAPPEWPGADDDAESGGTPSPGSTSGASSTTAANSPTSTSGPQDDESSSTGTSEDPAQGSSESGESTGESAGESTGDPAVNPACFELHVTCVQQAETVVDVEACEALFSQCASADHCEGTCPMVCPDPALQQCLDAYVGCTQRSTTVQDEAVCAENFDGCAAGITDDRCLPIYDPSEMEPCLEQHALCVECIETAADLYVCRDVFQACVSKDEPGSPGGDTDTDGATDSGSGTGISPGT